MKNSKSVNKYPAYTLLELLVVMSIFIILGGMTFSSFDGLQNTIKMNEYMLNLEQDIRNVQRSAMLLQRSPGEKWIYGLGVDFSNMGDDGMYKVFKWCSPFNDYGDDITTKSDIPAYDPSSGDISQASIPTTVTLSNTCGTEVTDNEILRTVPGYDRSLALPVSNIVLGNARFLLFESVSGRAFLYDINGDLLNYEATGKIIEDGNAIQDLNIEVTPLGKGATRTISVRHLSGKIDTNIGE